MMTSLSHINITDYLASSLHWYCACIIVLLYVSYSLTIVGPSAHFPGFGDQTFGIGLRSKDPLILKHIWSNLLEIYCILRRMFFDGPKRLC